MPCLPRTQKADKAFGNCSWKTRQRPVCQVFSPAGGGGIGIPSATTLVPGCWIGGGGGMGMPSTTLGLEFHKGVALDRLTCSNPISRIEHSEIVDAVIRILFCMGILLLFTMRLERIPGGQFTKKFRSRNKESFKRTYAPATTSTSSGYVSSRK
jgi:hypothetical protein